AVFAGGARPQRFIVQAWSRRGAPVGRPLEISPTVNVDAAFMSGDGRFAAVIPSPGDQPNAPIEIWNVRERRVVRTVPPSLTPFGGLPDFSADDSSIAMGKPAASESRPPQANAGPPSG